MKHEHIPTGLAAKCAHCKKRRGEHQARTLACPVGTKHRTVGWTSYSVTKVYEPRDKSV